MSIFSNFIQYFINKSLLLNLTDRKKKIIHRYINNLSIIIYFIIFYSIILYNNCLHTY